MLATNAAQKIDRVKQFGGDAVESRLVGLSYDDAAAAAEEYGRQEQAVFVHAFDDPLPIAGQGMVGKEIYDELAGAVDVVVTAIGGGGVISGVAGVFKDQGTQNSILRAGPGGAPSLGAPPRGGPARGRAGNGTLPGRGAG